MKSSEYLRDQRELYSLYVIQHRAIPHVADGLKSATRRVLWMAKDGKKIKSSALAGSCAPIHPHAAPEGSINTAAAPYNNNIPLLTGLGSFGTLLNPTVYGASRYTSVKLSEFAKDVVMVDLNLIPMVDNYDGTVQEPKHFLPLIPITLLNPQEGIAVGFASHILPRDITDIISAQILHLQGKTSKIKEAKPVLKPINQSAVDCTVDQHGNKRWIFQGAFRKINATTINITNLPYGISHKKFITNINKLEDVGTVLEVIDNSSDSYNINIRFKKGTLTNMNDDIIIKLVGLKVLLTENLNVINFDGTTVWSANYIDIITTFTTWRLQYYTTRFQVLADQLEIDIQRLRDILTAIKKNVGGLARKIKSKEELREYLKAINIVHVEYIADLPVYRFTEDERLKTENKLSENLKTMEYYLFVLNSESERKKIYVTELKEILKKVNTNCYASI